MYRDRFDFNAKIFRYPFLIQCGDMDKRNKQAEWLHNDPCLGDELSQLVPGLVFRPGLSALMPPIL